MADYGDNLAGRGAQGQGWKPAVCADCPAKHPSHSRDGTEGPWRCRPCHLRAKARDKADPFAIAATVADNRLL